ADLPVLGGYRAVLAGLAAKLARAGRPGGDRLPRTRRQRRRAGLGCRADQERPIHLPEADALAASDSVCGAAGRQDAGEGRAAAAAGPAGGVALELAPPG